MDICSSPKLFAAYHVFHRLLVPRHPPCALSSLTRCLPPRERLPTKKHSVASLVVCLLYLILSVCLRIFRYASDVLYLFTDEAFPNPKLANKFARFVFIVQCPTGFVCKHTIRLSAVRQLHRIFKIQFISICSFQGTLRKLLLPSGDGEIRTHDPLLARQVLSQLSYTPTVLFN